MSTTCTIFNISEKEVKFLLRCRNVINRYLEEQVKRDYPECEYLNRSWSNDPCPLKLLEKYNRMDLYRDIKFTYTSESIRSINSVEEFNAQFSGLNEISRLSFKEDGFNIQVNYYNGKPISAETRGRKGNSLNAIHM